jgi:plastocyanin
MIRRTLLVAAALAVGMVTSLPASAGGYCTEGQFSDRATDRVQLRNDCFTPTVARIEPGATLTWENVDGHPHTIGGVANTFGDAHKELLSGDSVSFVFDEEGVFPYFCVLHPGMSGAVVVGDGVGPATESGSVATIADEPVPPEGAAAKAAPATDPGLPVPLIVAMAVAGALLGIGTALLFRRRARARAA